VARTCLQRACRRVTRLKVPSFGAGWLLAILSYADLKDQVCIFCFCFFLRVGWSDGGLIPNDEALRLLTQCRTVSRCNGTLNCAARRAPMTAKMTFS
jgi:hypothetical protein